MKVKVFEATGPVLDWMVWHAAGGTAAYPKTANGMTFLKMWRGNNAKYIHPTTDWSQGGPIIEREEIATRPTRFGWEAVTEQSDYYSVCRLFGPTPLIAAMRCYVTSKLGNEVEVPEELLKQISGTKHENY